MTATLAGCTPVDEAAVELANAARPCLDRADAARPPSVPLRVVLAPDGSVALIEVQGRDTDQALYDAQAAAMRAIRACAPYSVGRTGEFDIVVDH